MKYGQRKFKRAVEVFISLAFFPVWCMARVLAAMVGKKLKPNCVILYYHSVPTSQRGAFARQMDVLSRLTTSINIECLPSFSTNVRYSAVTFDDFFQNVAQNAVPELKKRNIPCTIFVTTEVLGKRADWWPNPSSEREELIGTPESLKELCVDLVAVGSHTLTHPKLPLLSEMEAKREILESRLRLAELVNRSISTFSFPFGAFNNDLIGWCREAGYSRIFTTLPLMAFQGPEEFVTGRVKVDPTDWPLEFRLKVVGAYQWLPFAFALKKRIHSILLPTESRVMGPSEKGKSTASANGRSF